MNNKQTQQQTSQQLKTQLWYFLTLQFKIRLMIEMMLLIIFLHYREVKMNKSTTIYLVFSYCFATIHPILWPMFLDINQRPPFQKLKIG